jgi:endonuclease YncB( thermonuclease family)
MTMARRAVVFALLLVLAAIGPASAQQGIIGVACVIDGDTIEIHGQRIRLYSIDTPESVRVEIDQSYAIFPSLIITIKTGFVKGATTPCLIWSSP